MSLGAGGAAPGEAVGAIDIGTNTVLLLIARQEGGVLEPLLELATITRLGQGVDRTRTLHPDAVARTLASLEAYARELERRQVTRLAVVGTSAMRDATGGQDFIEAATRLLGVAPRVIAGRTEAELTFEGALSGLALSGPVTVFDIGGGSTEIISGRAGAEPVANSAVSLDVGSVRLFERHVHSDPVSASELAAVERDIEQALESASAADPSATLVGVAGTVTSLAAIELELASYDPKRVHGHVMTRATLFALTERLLALDLAARRGLSGLEAKRADVIAVGAVIARQVMRFALANTLTVSDRGVRWGVAQRLLEGRAF